MTKAKLDRLGQKVLYVYDDKSLKQFDSFFPNLSIRMMPSFLILSSALALFVGIFFQLLFDDKPIMEPL
jgi:hypothetical protein